MAWDVMSGVTKTAWDVMSGATKTAWDVLSGVANLCGMFCPGCQKMAWDVLSRDVLSGSRYNNICNKLLQANAPTYRVQTFLIKCTLNGYIRSYLSAEFQRGLGWSRPLLSLMSKYCLMILLITLTYVTLSDL